MYMYISGAELLTMFHSPTVGSHRIQTTLAAKFLSVNSSPTIHRLREKGPHPPYKEVSLKLGQGYCIQLFLPHAFFFLPFYFSKQFFPVLNSPRNSCVKREKNWDIWICPVFKFHSDIKDERGKIKTRANISLYTRVH